MNSWSICHCSRREAEIDFGAGHFRQHDAGALLYVFAGDDAGIELGIAALGSLRRKIRQRYLESFEDVHFRLFRWMVVSIPGLRSGTWPCSRATISMVPLDGSTTGLICVIAAV